jgi:hypothetical protein
MFVLHIARCTIREVDESMIETTIHHEQIPDDHLWCLVTYRNTARYPAVRVDHFPNREAAEQYRRRVEPEVPLVSLGGRAPAKTPSYEAFAAWKKAQNLKDYDYRSMFSGGSNPREVVTSPVPEWLRRARSRQR